MRLWRNWMLLTWVLLPGCRISVTDSYVTDSYVTGPKTLSGFLGRSLSVTCKYDDGLNIYKKYWCQGSIWSHCKVVVETTGSEEERTASRVFIKDNQTRMEFTVRLENLTQQDAGIYWCGIERSGYDYGFKVNITVLPDSEEPTTISRQTEPDLFITTTKQEQTTEQSTFSLTPPEYPIYVLFTLKTLILLCLGVAIFWMHRRHNQKRPSAASQQENAAR